MPASKEHLHRLIASHLASELVPEEVASRAGVGLGYVLSLQNAPDFQELLRDVSNPTPVEDLEPEALRDQVLLAAPDAIAVMIELMRDPRQNGATRYKAAEWVLAREATIAAMEQKTTDAPLIQQIIVDHRASEALERLVGENSSGGWAEKFAARLEEMPPTTT